MSRFVTAGVFEQLPDGNRRGARIDGLAGRRLEIGQDRERLIVQVERALLDQLQDRDRRNLFRIAGDAEHGIRLHGEIIFHVRQAVTAGQHELAVVSDRQLRPWDFVFANKIGHDLIERPQARSGFAGYLSLRGCGLQE